MVQPQNFLGLLIIYLALQHCLQNPNTTFQYWDMSHQMSWYILAHMPYFRRPGHILWHIFIILIAWLCNVIINWRRTIKASTGAIEHIECTIYPRKNSQAVKKDATGWRKLWNQSWWPVNDHKLLRIMSFNFLYGAKSQLFVSLSVIIHICTFWIQYWWQQLYLHVNVNFFVLPMIEHAV